MSMMLVLGFEAFAQNGVIPPEKAEPSPKEKEIKADNYFIDGLKHMMMDDHDKALAQFKLAAEIFPENSGINYQIAKVYKLKEDYTRALVHLGLALEQDPSNQHFYLMRAEILSETGKYAEAATVYEQLLQLDPEAKDIYPMLAEIYLTTGEHDKALIALRKTKEEIGYVPDMIIELQKVLIKLGQEDEAIKEGLEWIAAYPDLDDAHMAMAQLLLSLGRIEEAEQHLKNFLINVRENAEMRLMLAQISGISLNEDEDGTDANLKAAFNNPDLPIQSKIEILLGLMADLPDAELEKLIGELCVGLVNDNPTSGEAHAVYADFLYRIQRPGESIESYKKSIEYNKGNFQVWQNLLSLLLHSMDYEALDAYTESALEYFPNTANFYVFASLAKLNTGDLREAGYMLETANAYVQDGIDLKAILDLLNAYHQFLLGKATEGKTAIENILKTEPRNTDALNLLAKIHLAEKDTKKADEISERLLQINPNFADYLITRIRSLMAASKWDEALQICNKALKVGYGKALGIILESVGDIYHAKGNETEAIANWEKARKYGNTSTELHRKIGEKDAQN
jgi:tetratricopeptide (TPR) repeat protein